LSPEDLEKYVLVMREHNVTVFKTADVQIELGQAPAKPLPSRDPDAPIQAPKKNDYERMLFAATEGLPDEDE
jgi:hypothetical protein